MEKVEAYKRGEDPNVLDQQNGESSYRLDEANEDEAIQSHRVQTPFPLAKAKRESHNFMINTWKKQWQDSSTCEATKKFWKEPNEKRSAEMRSLNRSDHGKVTRFLTNFNFTGECKARINNRLSPWCKSCEELGIKVKETAFHIIYECPRYERRRREVFEDTRFNPEQMRPIKLAEFLNTEGIRQLEDR